MQLDTVAHKNQIKTTKFVEFSTTTKTLITKLMRNLWLDKHKLYLKHLFRFILAVKRQPKYPIHKTLNSGVNMLA